VELLRLKVKKIPIIVDAFHWEGRNSFVRLCKEFGLDYEDRRLYCTRDELFITTLEGTVTANVGDWILKGVEGELYPCKDSIFVKTYEIVSEQE
jgi:hypothetical protein